MNQSGGQQLPVDFLLTSFSEFIKLVSEKRQDKDAILGKVQNFINFAQRNNYDYKLCQEFLNYSPTKVQPSFKQRSLEDINLQQTQKLKTYDGSSNVFTHVTEEQEQFQNNFQNNFQTNDTNIINRECLRCKQIFLVDTSNFLVSISHFCQNCKLSYSNNKAL